jgi:hypothetical protein
MRQTPFGFARLLAEIVEPHRTSSVKQVTLDAIDVLSLLAAASWNVNFMALDRFLRELGFLPRYRAQRACRLSADIPIVVLVAEFQRGPRSERRAQLVFVECGKYRASAAFFEDAIAFIRGADVVTYQVASLDDSTLVNSSFYAIAARDQPPGTSGNRIPPAA